MDDKKFSTAQAQFALLGHELKKDKYPDGAVIFSVSRWGQSRLFSNWQDVLAFLTQVGGWKVAPETETTSPEKREFLKNLARSLPGSSCATQSQRLLEALRHGPVSTNEARRFLDVYDPASRVRDLRHQDGYEIETVRCDSETEQGVRHRVGLYILRKGAAV